MKDIDMLHGSRESVFSHIPDGVSRILDFGCGDGKFLKRLKQDKGATILYGIDIKSCQAEDELDGFCRIDLQETYEQLPEEFDNFFNYIIVQDVLEHLYDPWFVMAKLNDYLAADGELIIVTPNMQYYFFALSLLLSGDFPYGEPGGLMNEEHIRWFGLCNLVEMAIWTGYVPETCLVFFPQPEIVPQLPDNPYEVVNVLELPPPLHRFDQAVCSTIVLPRNVRGMLSLYYANKIGLICKKSLSGSLIKEPTRAGAFEELRQDNTLLSAVAATMDAFLERLGRKQDAEGTNIR